MYLIFMPGNQNHGLHFLQKVD